MPTELIYHPENTLAALSEVNSTFKTICNLCSIGCQLQISHDNGKVIDVDGLKGLINLDGTICAYPKISYKIIDESNRVTQPLLRVGTKLVPIEWDKAMEIVFSKIKDGDPSEKAFFAGARLTNEEQYLVQKLARAGAYTNNIGSFHYLGRGTNYTKLSRANIPFAELVEAKRVFIIGAEVCRDNPVASYYIFNNSEKLNIPVQLVTNDPTSSLLSKCGSYVMIKSYFSFIKAVNYFIVDNKLEDVEYLKNLVDNTDEFKENILKYDYNELLEQAGVEHRAVERFAKKYNNEHNAVLVFSENELSGHTCGELFNLALLTGKHGRTGAGLMLLKENSNTHGLHDIGVMWNLGPGATPWDDPMQRSTVQFHWGSHELTDERGSTLHALKDPGYKNIFVFGEDPVGCAINPEEMKDMLSKSEFLMVQDYSLTPTAQLADLVLPASFPYESGGTFTNCQRVIQKIDKSVKSPLTMDSWEQVNELLFRCGYDKLETVDDVTFEIASLLPKYCTSSKLLFRLNDQDNFNPLFHNGCDSLFHETFIEARRQGIDC